MIPAAPDPRILRMRFGLHWGSTIYIGLISSVGRTEVTAIEKFRAVMESAGEGENVGLLMRGLTRDALRSGDVVTSS